MSLLVGSPSETSESEGGYILATTALLQIPLMIFAAFAVDVGGWYAEADQAQRADDDAGLAGVVHVGNPTAMNDAAIEVAAANGYVDQPDAPAGLYPQVIATATGPNEVEVQIFTEGESHFGQVVLPDGIEIHRRAKAALNRSIPMGTPTNALGTGRDTIYGTGDPDNFWLNIHSSGSERHVGDPLSVDFSTTNSSYDSHPGAPNDLKDDRGFLYLVTVPPGSVGYTLETRVSCFPDNDASLSLTLYNPDTTPNDYADNIDPGNVASLDGGTAAAGGAAVYNEVSCTYNPLAAQESLNWQDVKQNLTPGVWVLSAKSTNTSSYGRLLYSLRVTGSFGVSCSTIPSATNPAAAAAQCPTISAYNYLGVYSDEDMFPYEGTTPAGYTGPARISGGTNDGRVNAPIDLWLAEVGPENSRSALEVLMFDTADGIEQVEILLPPDASGVRHPAPLRWESVAESGHTDVYQMSNADRNACTGGTGPSGTATCVRREPLRFSFFQDRLIKIVVDFNDVPGGYSCSSDCWLKIRYTSGTNAALGETTSWRARIIGDPIRLVE